LLSAGLGLLRQLVDAALAATLMTVPICAYYFFEVQPAGVLGNLLAVPVGELVVLPVGLLGTLLGVWAPAVGGPLLDLAASASAVMLASASWLAALGYSWTVPPPSSWQVALWAVGLCAWAGRRGWLAIGLLGLALVSYLLLAMSPVGQLVTTFLDVGQGDAAVIELPLGQVVVVDAGPALPDGRDLGALVVAPFLRWRGHRSIELLIASHRHPDHIGGLTTLIEQFPVARLWLPPGALLGAETSAEAARLAVAWQQVVAVARRRGVQIESPATVQIGGASLEVLSPCQGSVVGGCRLSPQPDWGENDNSLVLRLRFAGRTLLLPGDLELAGELALLDRQDLADSLVADVLKAPHHCSRTSSSESLIAAVAPRWAVCSVGQQNRFGFPHPDVVARYRVANSTLLRTDRQGAVTVIIAPDGQLRVQTVE
jgi:competence protein ComEC